MDDRKALPLPDPDSLGAFFWEGAREGRLLIQRCSGCGTFIHYPRPVCRVCLSRDLAPQPVSGRGTVYSHTVMMQAFHPFFEDRVPYVLATVELVEQEGLRVMTNIVGCEPDHVRVGMPVEVTFEQLTADLTVPQVRPAAGTV
jgi:uncharacterized OB-fold protein